MKKICFKNYVVAVSLATLSSAAVAHSFKIGGYVKLDGNFTKYSNGLPPADNSFSSNLRDFLLPSVISTDSTKSSKSDFHASAKESRLWVKHNLEKYGCKSYAEVDFQFSGQGNRVVTNSYAPRLRQFYVSNGKMLAGQTWSTFMNVSALPATLDFSGTAGGRIFNRQAQLRLTFNNFNLAFENPHSNILDNNAITNAQTTRNVMPDIVLRYNADLGHKSNISLSALSRVVSHDSDTKGNSTKWAGALGIGGKYNISHSSDVRFMAHTGKGLGRYLNGLFADGVLDTNSKVETFNTKGFTLSLLHKWNDKFQSTIALAGSKASTGSSSLAGGAPKKYMSSHMNVIYNINAQTFTGLEWIHSKRKNKDDTKGHLNRLQLSIKHSFSS